MSHHNYSHRQRGVPMGAAPRLPTIAILPIGDCRLAIGDWRLAIAGFGQTGQNRGLRIENWATKITANQGLSNQIKPNQTVENKKTKQKSKNSEKRKSGKRKLKQKGFGRE